MKPAYNHKDEVCWKFEFNGIPVRAIKKKNKYGDLVGKTYLYTDTPDGLSYYNTTAFAVFSQKFYITQLSGIELEAPEI